MPVNLINPFHFAPKLGGLNLALFLLTAPAMVCAQAAYGETPSAVASCANISSPLTLPQAINRALCVDPNGWRYQAEAAAAKASVQEREASFRPTWQASGGPALGLQAGSDRGTSNISASAQISVSQLLRDGGQRTALLNQAKADLQQSAHTAALARQNLVREVVDLWADVLDANAALQAAEFAMRAALASLAVANGRFAAGSATKVDVLSAQSAAAQAQRDAVAGELGSRKASGNLAQRLRLGDQGDLALGGSGWSDLPLPDLWASASLSWLIQEHLPQHPRWLSAQARVEAALAGLEATKASAKPQLRLNASTGPSASRSNSASPVGAYSNTQQWGSNVALQWSATFADGGSRDASAARAQALVDSAKASLSDTERALERTLLQAQLEWQNSSATLNASRVALSAAEAIEAVQRGRYAAGIGAITDVLSAQSTLAQRQLQLAQAEQRSLRNRAALLEALGQLEPSAR